ncbi:YihY/virulence factor BrkB family protein [Pseudogracilibacillus sp. SE30717A]|uniref:YihY/virulence factor BrkB family protein n=1 Tax=Pseudogracilibacillus sp. SE30717A TaxID=3098293 RepID=UPI00300E643D
MQRIILFGKNFFKRFQQADVTDLSAQLAYFFLLSLFPFLLFLVTLIGYLPIDNHAVIDMLASYLPEQVVEMIDSNLEHIINTKSGGLLSIGIIGTIWSASNGINAITKSFNRAYAIEKERPFLVARSIAILLTFGMIIVIAVALLLPVFGKIIGEQFFAWFHLSEDFLKSWNMLRWVVSSIIFFIVFFALYLLAPHTKVKARHAVWGTLFATIAWQITSLGFSFYVNKLGNYSATYGSLGTVIILMIWFYLSGIIINSGGVLNAFMKDREIGRKH